MRISVWAKHGAGEQEAETVNAVTFEEAGSLVQLKEPALLTRTNEGLAVPNSLNQMFPDTYAFGNWNC